MTALQRLDIQASVEEGDWPPEEDLVAMASHVLEHAADHLVRTQGQPFGADPVEVSLVFTDDASMRAINAEWRSQDKPTNVLSFPAFPLQPGGMPGPMLGDIVMARETIERESADLGKPLEQHLTHLLVHGFLHLFGYDHMENDEAEEMEGLESRILAELDISDPYAGQDPV